MTKNELPTTKTITYPVWRDRRRHMFSINDITGAFAMWAIRQSPYAVPDGLAQAVTELGQKLSGLTEFKDGLAKLSIDEIKTVLCQCFDNIPIILAWNEPKNKHQNKWLLVSGYDAPKPDDDFIDLDALICNVSHTLIMEQLVNEIELEPYQG